MPLRPVHITPPPRSCRQYHQLEGREQELRGLIEAEYLAGMRRYASAARDDRAETHLSVAALALASHKALLPFLGDEQEVLQVGPQRPAAAGCARRTGQGTDRPVAAQYGQRGAGCLPPCLPASLEPTNV